MFKAALKEATWVFVLSRLTILLVSYICVVFLPQYGQLLPMDCASHGFPGPCLLAWFHFDAIVYAVIADHGYASTPNVAFFPLWPLLMHLGSLPIAGIPFASYVTGLILANVCFYVALVLLYCLLCEDFEASLAKRALFYLAFYPYALFFFVGYSESLFLLLSVALFLLLRRGRALDWWFAGGIGFLAALTRSTGVLLSIPYFIMYVRHFWVAEKRMKTGWLQKIGALIPILLIPMGIVAYILYLGYTKGNPLIFQVEEAVKWHRHFDWIWLTAGYIIQLLFTYPLFSMDTLRNVLEFAFTLIPIGVLIGGWRRIPLEYSLYALAAMLFSLSFPLATIHPLTSQQRYMIVLFPLFVILAIWGRNSRFNQVYVAIGPPLLAVFTILFVSHYWVA
jgi:hypothetical protein